MLTDKLQEELSKYTVDSLISLAKKEALKTGIKGWVDTDSEKLNSVLGHPVLGLPLGRLIEIYGGESHGKTALLYYLRLSCSSYN
jgi:RecA/RadA recombinase